ncbi:DUF4892 domain-containing protein [Stutzerimonas kirkiae]|uniref:DUF4892 domain-containing protein n=1 Tax=Stutzerimonas kirkiae TaxID=2211392 RepID=A0A4Q9R0Z6_9GAMM|nr:DUF4892 domain-containing protein [Stutzerimonas kirkiae]TBU91307.1 DUF4892 domain-containing protein [Stutzerimonas kirkiae]TBV00423.1 DUF4892 domain-containing protein [Stutzerimonas kirkiae]TBV11789.1 DUF4892 domain-containing protein [Stutzerimonas kirkiae]TBV15284.1 DUF4892 domain-containing protein [Stutzerimonas kirkiae]
MRSPWIAGLALLASSVWAVEPPGSADLQMLPRYPQAQIIDFRQESVAERIFPQDAIRRISGQLRMSAQVAASGELTRITYQLPAAHSGLEAFTEARQTLLDAGGQLLFWCEGRECGSSSLWANEVFGRSSLYGPDAQQAYLLARDEQSLFALYGITRGNGRAYLQVERLLTERSLAEILPTAATLSRQLRSVGSLRLAHLSGEPAGEWVALLASMLRLDSTQRVVLSGTSAAAWREALIGERIRATRLELDEGDEAGLSIGLLR